MSILQLSKGIDANPHGCACEDIIMRSNTLVMKRATV